MNNVLVSLCRSLWKSQPPQHYQKEVRVVCCGCCMCICTALGNIVMYQCTLELPTPYHWWILE